MTILAKNTHTAFITESFVYIANNGMIYKKINLAEFVNEGWSEAIDTTAESKIAIYENGISGKSLKKAKREEEHRIKAAAEYEQRKANIIGLWNWRHGRATAFIVKTFEEENSDRSCNYESETTLFFSEEAALIFFEKVRETAPDKVGYYFNTELLELATTEDSLDIANIEDLKDAILDAGNITLSESYAKPLEEGTIIVTLYHRQHGSSGRYERAEYPRTWSGYLSKHSSYYSKHETLADLAAFQDHSGTYYQTSMTIADAVESYGQSVIDDLSLTKDEAISAGFSEEMIEQYFTENEDSNG